MKIYDPPPFGAGINLVAGSTGVTGGTANGILWKNAGVLAVGAATLAGGTALAGVTSVAINGATIGTNALAITGTADFDGGSGGGGLTYSAGNLTAAGTIRSVGNTQAGAIVLGSPGSLITSVTDGIFLFQKNNATTIGAAVVLPAQTVAQLPAAATAGAGAMAFVTDASTTVILGLGLTVVGGGANKVPVYSDGANWIIG